MDSFAKQGHNALVGCHILGCGRGPFCGAKVFIRQIETQARVIVSLAVREMDAEYARYTFGYLWAFAEPVFYVILLTAMHVFIRRMGASAHNMTPILFIVFGTMPWLAFSRTLNSTYRIVFANKHVLQLPGTTTLDIVSSHMLVQFVTYNTVFLVFLTLAAWWEGVWPPRNLLAVLLYFNASLALGGAAGMMLIPVHRTFPTIEHFMMIPLRIGFWTSGLFFVIAQVPAKAWPLLTWNPLLHVTELIRSSWFTTYDTPVGSPWYVVGSIFVLGSLGLAADRMLRSVPA